jgi:hypothetical protein
MERTREELTTDDNPPNRDEAAIREMLEQSRRDISEGRIVPLAPVLARMRATAKRVRQARGPKGKTKRRME